MASRFPGIQYPELFKAPYKISFSSYSLLSLLFSPKQWPICVHFVLLYKYLIPGNFHGHESAGSQFLRKGNKDASFCRGHAGCIVTLWKVTGGERAKRGWGREGVRGSLTSLFYSKLYSYVMNPHESIHSSFIAWSSNTRTHLLTLLHLEVKLPIHVFGRIYSNHCLWY